MMGDDVLIVDNGNVIRIHNCTENVSWYKLIDSERAGYFADLFLKMERRLRKIEIDNLKNMQEEQDELG